MNKKGMRRLVENNIKFAVIKSKRLTEVLGKQEDQEANHTHNE